MFDWEKLLIKPNDSLEHAINILNKEGCRIVLVTDKHKKLLGTVTDGDIRRALINKTTMDSEVRTLMNNQPVKKNKSLSRKELLSSMLIKGLIHMPIVDENGILCDLQTIQHLIENPSFDNPVFIMAGGFGTRLYPLTKNIPKPLLKVGNKPILEIIIDQFINHGFHDFYISTHFKPELIKNYFSNGNKYGVSIKYVEEDVPLGTAGSLGLLPDNLANLPIIVMNGDILTRVDFKNLLDFHNNNNADATMCVREYDFQVPYGVVQVDDCNIRDIQEKPVHKFFVNAGIYVLNKDLIDKVDGKSYLDMTDFLKQEINGGMVNAFPIHEYWLDIGRMDEYRQAQIDITKIF
jgi:dTDP-glucose pyrophosphorylase